jgi:putative pyruvate formate lyase activating enzyme
MSEFEPGYVRLHRKGRLRPRVERAVAGLAECRVCPRDCGIDRLADERAVCKTGRWARVASAFPHMGEENCLRGWRGSGTVFFCGCNLRCVFCQNFDTSQGTAGYETDPLELVGLMLELQERGCHNINWVTPEHVVPQALEGLLIAAEAGLRLPIVYNTSAYDSLESLRLLDGIVDIYMPDFKMWDEELALRYLKARDYPPVARAALREMHRQVGALEIDERGLARRGVLVRHLIMPGLVEDSAAIMDFLAELSPDTYVNVMTQYYPAGKVTAERYGELNRPVRHDEYQQVMDAARDAGLWRFDRR